jgi:hypothetical protein
LQSVPAPGIISAEKNAMATMNVPPNKSEPVVVGPRDVLFECPACHKSLVIDEAAEGMIVDCPQCKTPVIVPPKAPPAVAAAPRPSTEVAPAPTGEVAASDVTEQIIALGSKLKELQTQRTEIATNVAARLNEINRQMVMLSRLEASHQQVMAEWNQLLGQVRGGGRTQANFKA